MSTSRTWVSLTSDTDRIALANSSLPPNLSALNTRFAAGSRADRSLRVCYRPELGSFSFFSLSGGVVAEMLDQAAAHCGTFVTSHGCPTLTMTVTYLRRGCGVQP
jgi:acyl-coenzyme A thioesterase PaaI-like protein